MHGIATSTTTVADDVYGDYGTTVRFDLAPDQRLWFDAQELRIAA